MIRTRLALLFSVCLIPVVQSSTQTAFFVAPPPAGNDSTGDGSSGQPWATITHALDSVPDGSTVLVRPGFYEGRVNLRGQFAQGVTVRSEVPHRAQLRNDGTVVICYYGQGIALEGFDIAHSGPGAGALVIQIQDLLGDTPGAEPRVSRIALRNNVIHDSFNNDLLKINNGAHDVLVEGNMFHNQEGSDEHIDINSATLVTVQDNIFFNDFAGSGRTNGNDTSSFIVVKDSNGADDANIGSQHITIRRNVFLNWEGSTGSNFVLLGEDGNPYHEATDVLVENNLMLGNAANVMRAAFGVKGCSDVVFRHNTIVGNLPSLAFAMRLNTEGSNLPNEQIRFHGNIWCDPTGSMEDFSDTPPGETASFTISGNLMWNGGSPIPEDGSELVNPSDDASRVVGDPALPWPLTPALPRWIPATGEFADGSASIREAFERLVNLWGRPMAGSAALGPADPAQSPGEDILGHPRDASPDIGAVEVLSAVGLALN